MPTLAQTLETTTPVSPLLRKARRLGIGSVEDMIALAASRGCSHYTPGTRSVSIPTPANELGNEELTILLIIGENSYEPTAIRCAAQLARSPGIMSAQLARLALMEKCERVLAHIARAGIDHDADGAAFWQDLLNRLHAPPARQESALPHWTRFVSMPGIQRDGSAQTRWLVPRP